MTQRARIIAMVQLPPPLHGAALMNAHAITALEQTCDVTLLEMRFAKHPRDIAKFTLGKLALALGLWLRLIVCLMRSPNAFYICFSPSGGAFYRDCLYVVTARIFGVPAIVHLHGRGLANGRRNAVTGWLQRRVFTGQAAIVLGKALLPELDGLDCQTTIIANCLPDAAFTVERHKTDHNTLRLLYLSNLFRAKGIDDVVAACAILKQRGIDFTLDIAGSEGDLSETDLMHMIKQAGISDQVIWHGFANTDARSELHATADLFVFPSRYANEAQPLVVLEAMAAGIPVICSSVGTLGDIIINGKTGRICPTQNPEILTRLIEDAMTNPTQNAAMTKAARTYCKANFGKDRFARELQDLITEIVS